MGRKHKSRSSKVVLVDPTQGMNPTQCVESESICSTLSSAKKLPSIDIFLAQLKGIVATEEVKYEDYDVIISNLEKKIENLHAASTLIKTSQGERSVHTASVENSQKSESVTPDASANVFLVESDRLLFNGLPVDIQELVLNMKNANTKMIETTISVLGQKSNDFLSAINMLRQVRNEKTPTSESLRKHEVTTSEESNGVSNASSIEADNLHSCQLLDKTLKDLDEDVSSLHLKEDICYADSEELKLRPVHDRDITVLNEIRRSLGLSSQKECVLEAVQAVQNQIHQEQEKNELTRIILSEKEDALKQQVSEKQDLLQKHEEIQKENMNLKGLLETERHTSKTMLKKTRKEKANIMKKLKRMTDEQAVLLEKLSSTTSDESLHVVSDESSSNSPTVANDDPSKFKALNSQRISEFSQKEFDEVCQRLETSEKSLEVQQELNADITKQSAEYRARYKSEIQELEEVIQEMKIYGKKQNEELLRIKELERTKTDVLVDLLEGEKQDIRDECDVLRIQLDAARKSLMDQKAESKRHLESEIWKLKKAAKTERRKAESMEIEKLGDRNSEIGSIESSDSNDACIQAVKLSFEKKLKEEVSTSNELRAKVNQLEVKLQDISQSHDLKETAVHELVVEIDKKDNELQAEKKKFADLQQEVLESIEKEDVSAKRWRSLNEREMKLEVMRVEYETSSTEMMKSVSNSEKEKSALKAELDDLKKIIVHKNTEIEKQNEEKYIIQREYEIITKKLDETLSPRKDKATQLESRLEVMQVAAKAQQKRLEEDLFSTRARLDVVTGENQDFQEQIKVLEEQLLIAEEKQLLAEKRSKENEDAAVVLHQTLSELQETNKVLHHENAEERAGLVNELIDTKQKMKECLQSSSVQILHLEKIQTLEEELKSAKAVIDEFKTRPPGSQLSDQATIQTPSVIDKLFPHLDPVFRQLVHLLAQNQNYMYGILGLFIYALLIHLYILL